MFNAIYPGIDNNTYILQVNKVYYFFDFTSGKAKCGKVGSWFKISTMFEV